MHACVHAAVRGTMRKWLIAASLVLFAVCAAWVWYRPAFDSISALCASVVGVIVALMSGRDGRTGGMVQNVGTGGSGIQVGRDYTNGNK